MAKKLKTYDVLVAFDVSVYGHVTINAKSPEDAEQRAENILKKKGQFPEVDDLDICWEYETNHRVVDGSTEEVAP